jgi:hypothetical protein
MTKEQAKELVKKFNIDLNSVDNCVVTSIGEIYYNTDIDFLRGELKGVDLIVLKGEAVAEPIEEPKKKVSNGTK